MKTKKKAVKRTLTVGVLCSGILFSSLGKTKLVPPSLDILFRWRAGSQLLMMNHVVGGVRRNKGVLTIVEMLRGTAEAYQSLNLRSEARLS